MVGPYTLRSVVPCDRSLQSTLQFMVSLGWLTKDEAGLKFDAISHTNENDVGNANLSNKGRSSINAQSSTMSNNVVRSGVRRNVGKKAGAPPAAMNTPLSSSNPVMNPSRSNRYNNTNNNAWGRGPR